MIVYFDEGVNRVWYKPANFQTGLAVTIRLYDPDLKLRVPTQFTEFQEGLYYVDFNFDKRGSWIGIVYENGVKVTSDTFSVGMSRPGIVGR